MSKLRLTESMELKKMVESISKINHQAFLEFSHDSLFFQVISNKNHLYALLKIKSSFFQEYYLTKQFIIKFDISKFDKILQSISDYDEVEISIQDDKPISHLDLLFKSQVMDTDRRDKLKVTEVLNAERPRRGNEPDYDFRIGIQSSIFGFIVEKSANVKEPISVNVRSNILTLTSGCHTFSLKSSQWESDNAPPTYDLLLNLHDQADCFVLASELADEVYIKDSNTSFRRELPLLEFPNGEFCKLQFYFPMRFWVG